MTKANTKSTKATNTGSANSEKITGAVNAPAAAEVIKAPTKADKARAIFDAAYATSPVPARKDILAQVRTEAGLSVAGAATYLQNYKDKHGLSVKKTGTAPAAEKAAVAS